MPVVKGGQNMLRLVGIGLTDLQNIGGATGPPPAPTVPASLHYRIKSRLYVVCLFDQAFPCMYRFKYTVLHSD